MQSVGGDPASRSSARSADVCYVDPREASRQRFLLSELVEGVGQPLQLVGCAEAGSCRNHRPVGYRDGDHSTRRELQRSDGVVDLHQRGPILLDRSALDQVVDPDEDADQLRLELAEVAELVGDQVFGREAVDRGIREPDLLVPIAVVRRAARIDG